MIRAILTIFLTLILLGACLGMMTRCTACVLCVASPPVADSIHAEPVTEIAKKRPKRPDWKKIKPRKSEPSRDIQNDEDRDIGRPKFIKD